MRRFCFCFYRRLRAFDWKIFRILCHTQQKFYESFFILTIQSVSIDDICCRQSSQFYIFKKTLTRTRKFLKYQEAQFVFIHTSYSFIDHWTLTIWRNLNHNQIKKDSRRRWTNLYLVIMLSSTVQVDFSSTIWILFPVYVQTKILRLAKNFFILSRYTFVYGNWNYMREAAVWWWQEVINVQCYANRTFLFILKLRLTVTMLEGLSATFKSKKGNIKCMLSIVKKCVMQTEL